MSRIAPIVLAGAMLVTQTGCSDKRLPASPSPPTAPSGTPGILAEPLRDAARASGKLLGAAVQSGYLADGRYAGVLGRHFNYLTAEYEMKWDAIDPSRRRHHFS